MADEVKIPVKTTYDGKGFDQLRRDAERARREEIKATKEQIAEHRNLMKLTSQLDRNLAGPKKSNFAQQLTQDFAATYLSIQAVEGALSTVTNFAIEFGQQSITAARESAAADAQLLAVLDSTKGAAGLTADELDRMANSFQKTTMFTDEQVKQGESLLLTFTNIGKDVFPGATQAILDMSTAMDQDVKSSAIQLGKALNDPVAGLSALSRVGVTFSDSQKEMIESMVATGDIAGAQKIILGELNKEFGGSAEAARIAAGGVQDAVVAYGDLQEVVGSLATNSSVSDIFGRAAAGAIEDFKNDLLLTISVVDMVTDSLGGLGLAGENAFDTLKNTASFISDIFDYAGFNTTAGAIDYVIEGAERQKEIAEEQQRAKEERAKRDAERLKEQSLNEVTTAEETAASEVEINQTKYETMNQQLADAIAAKITAQQLAKDKSVEITKDEMASIADVVQNELEALIGPAGEIGQQTAQNFVDQFNRTIENADFAKPNISISTNISNGPGPAETPAASKPKSQPFKKPGGAATKTATGLPFAGFAEGVKDFIVPPGFPNDSYVVGLSSGERVNVAPAGQGGGITINLSVGHGDDTALAKRLAGAITATAEQVVNQYHSEVIAPWSNG